MENQVTMSLEEYTKLVLEKQKLEIQLNSLKRRAESKIEEEIKDSLINNLSKEETVQWLSSDPKSLLSKFGPYSWTYTSIANDVLILKEEEVKDMAVTLITKMLNSHLNDILEKENQSNE